MRFVRYGWIFFLLTGCLGEPDCVETNTNLVNIVFRINASTTREITFNQITVTGLTQKFYEGQKVTTVSLPLDPSTNSATFTFMFENRTETIKLKYKVQSKIISASCGAFLVFEDLSIEESTFDALTILNSQLLKNANNIQIYLE